MTSFTKQVAEQVCSLGRADVDDLAAIFHDHTRDQIYKGLANARNQRLISLIEKPKVLGPRKGMTSGVYGPPVEEKVEAPTMPWPVSSIFELGARLEAIA